MWDGPQFPLQYLRAFARKANALRQWLAKAKGSQVLNEAISLADLLHPETFLSAFRQRSARTLKCGIDDLRLVSSFQSGAVKAETISVLTNSNE